MRPSPQDLVVASEEDPTPGSPADAHGLRALKLITWPEKMRKNARKKVTCFTKDNIMKLTDGLPRCPRSRRSTQEDIANEHGSWTSARLATAQVHVIVMPNLFLPTSTGRRADAFLVGLARLPGDASDARVIQTRYSRPAGTS
jgi:isocitrate dehydrogenase